MRLHTLSMALAGAGLLVACGGDSSSTPAAPATPTPITLSGVVAKGAALVGATVEAKCATGTGTATSSGTGAYTLTIADGALPCVLEATGTGADAGLVLHSVATGSGGTATANITPVTELLVAQITGQDPAAFMDAANASSLASTVTSTNIDTAKTAVIATLTAAGLDTTALATVDMVSGTLAAGTGTSYDGVLDALGAALATSGTTLTEMTASVATAAAGTTTAGEATPATSLLPAGLLLRPKAATCDALRSTDYRLIKFASSTAAEDLAHTAVEDFSINAETLVADFGGGDTMQLTAVADTQCRYTFDAGDIFVAKSGVIVIRGLVGADDDTVATADRNANRMMIALPKQDLSLADLAGDWSVIGAERTTPLEGWGAYASISSTGVVSNFACTEDALTVATASCAPSANAHSERFTKNANGSFTWSAGPTDPDQWSDSAFAYRSGNGDVMIVSLTAWGEPMLAVKRRAAVLPTVGQTYANWNVVVDRNLVAGPISEVSHTVDSVDAATGTVVRSSLENGTTTSQTLVYNTARTGYIQRTASTGVRPMSVLAMPGFGLSGIFLPNTLTSPSDNSRFGISVRQ